VRFKHHGMALWYGTDDVPAPVGATATVDQLCPRGSSRFSSKPGEDMAYSRSRTAQLRTALPETSVLLDDHVGHAALPVRRVGDPLKRGIDYSCGSLTPTRTLHHAALEGPARS
jgi:hypothetical protein